MLEELKHTNTEKRAHNVLLILTLAAVFEISFNAYCSVETHTIVKILSHLPRVSYKPKKN
jgi:hypothetical protein